MTDQTAYIERLHAFSEATTEERHVACQFLAIYEEARLHSGGTFLELGVDKGVSTRALLAACDEVGGTLVSVDIRDCSAAVQSPHWQFLQANSIDRDFICGQATHLLRGIDVIFVDSLHTAEHVLKEIYTWFDLVKKDGVLFFRDIDSGPYMKGCRKNDAAIEIANRRIKYALEDVFYANVGAIDYSTIYGSTGLGIMRKRSQSFEGLAPYKRLRRRNYRALARFMRRIGMGPRYSNRSGLNRLGKNWWVLGGSNPSLK